MLQKEKDEFFSYRADREFKKNTCIEVIKSQRKTWLCSEKKKKKGAGPAVFSVGWKEPAKFNLMTGFNCIITSKQAAPCRTLDYSGSFFPKKIIWKQKEEKIEKNVSKEKTQKRSQEHKEDATES